MFETIFGKKDNGEDEKINTLRSDQSQVCMGKK